MSARLSQIAETPAEPASPRVRHLLDTAWTQFRRHGYGKVSVDSLARESGVSKETIYRHFGGKEAIFRAALQFSGSSFMHGLPELQGRKALNPVDLQDCVRAIYKAALDQERPASFWISIALANEFPELAASLHQQSTAWLAPIADYLAAHIRPKLSAAEALEVTNRLGALAIEGPALMMCADPKSPAERDACAAKVTHLLLWGCPSPERPLQAAPSAPAQEPTPSAVKPADRMSAAPEPNAGGLLAAARSAFFVQGYDQANLDLIGRQAQVGRGTIYKTYRSKAGLFTAAMLDGAHAVAATSSGLVQPDGDDFTADLEQAAFAVSRVFLNPQTIQLYRSVIAERNWNPQLAKQVYKISRGPLRTAIAGMLEGYQARLRILLEDPQWWAMQFMTMATAGNRYLSLAKPPGIAARRKLARATAELFAGGICNVSRSFSEAG